MTKTELETKATIAQMRAESLRQMYLNAVDDAKTLTDMAAAAK
tara:strand:- start:211 stop:339 length:129 start_codon:yes stop_codon:yes gene_type:complete